GFGGSYGPKWIWCTAATGVQGAPGREAADRRRRVGGAGRAPLGQESGRDAPGAAVPLTGTTPALVRRRFTLPGPPCAASSGRASPDGTPWTPPPRRPAGGPQSPGARTCRQ